MLLKKTLESLLDSKEIKPVNPIGNQPWIFIGRTDAKAESPILWPPDMKSWHIRKDPDTGKHWRQGKGTREEEMHHWRNGHEFEQPLRDSGEQGSLACCSPWDLKEGHNLATEQQQHVASFSKKWFKWIYLQNRNRVTDVENKHRYEGGMGGEGKTGRLGLTYTHYYI